MRVLVLKPGALGDLLLALPAIGALGRKFPGAEIDVAGNASFVPVLSLTPTVARRLDFGSQLFAGLFGESSPPPELVKALSVYDLAVVWLADPDGALHSRLLACGVTRVVGGDPARRSSIGPHMSRRLHDLLAGIDPPAFEPLALERRVPTEPGLALLHPGSGGRAKMWPAENFASLQRELDRKGYSTRILIGPAEEDLAGRFPVCIRPKDVLDLACHLSAASLYIGNDSGPTHLAVALGLRTVALFGPTDPALWSPIGPRVHVLGGNGRWPTLAEVLGALA